MLLFYLIHSQERFFAFVLAVALHQVANCVFGGHALKEHLVCLINNGHFYSDFFCQGMGSAAGFNALYHHFDLCLGFLHRLALSNQDSGAAVSRVHTGTGDNQITDTGAWTGSMIASLLDIRMKYALPAILAGIMIAGVIMILLCGGILNLGALGEIMTQQ